MIVVDNSVLVPAFVPSADSGLAKTVAAADAVWIVPPLWQFEFTNALATMVRGKLVSQDAAECAIVDARVAVTNREVPVDQQGVLRLAVRLNLSAYDAQYIALARDYGVRCVTADRRLARHAKDWTTLLDEFAA